MDKNNVNILAIETSCDETSVAVVTNGKEVKSNMIYTQIATHKAYGGVVPEIASREHLSKISLMVKAAIEESGLNKSDITAVAVTKGPGLVGSLLVGLSYAKAMALALDVPLIGVHHIAGHIYGGLLANQEVSMPLIALIISGGHSNIVYMNEHLTFETMGQTRDDAAGEVLDKIARSLGLPYPGGADLERLALEGDGKAINFPRAWLEKGTYDFSFSGLKSSVLNYMNRLDMKGEQYNKADIAASFQEALFEVLARKAVDAAIAKGVKSIVLSGGVAANTRVKAVIDEMAKPHGISVYAPTKILCTDNAAMIGAVAYEYYTRDKFSDLMLNSVASMPLLVK